MAVLVISILGLILITSVSVISKIQKSLFFFCRISFVNFDLSFLISLIYLFAVNGNLSHGGQSCLIVAIFLSVRFGCPAAKEYGAVYWSNFQRTEWSSRYCQRVLAELSVKEFYNFRVSYPKST
jgi:hypothetical protein